MEGAIEPIRSEKLRTAILSSLGLLAVLVIAMAIVGDYPEEVIVIDPNSELLGTVAAYCFGIACLAGLVSIFAKSIRRPLLIAVCVGTVVFLIFGCANFLFSKISYKVAKNAEPVERLCVVTNHTHNHSEWVEEDDRGYETTHSTDNYTMILRFLDDGHEEMLSDRNAINYWKLEEGDTCVAYVRKGLAGMQFVTYLKRYKAPLQLGDDFERIGN